MELTNEQLDKLYKICRSKALRLGFSDEADDAASEYICRVIERGRPQRIDWFLRDYIDARRANCRILSSPDGILSGGATLRHSSSESTEDCDPESIFGSGGDKGEGIFCSGAYEGIVALLSSAEREVYQMMIEGMNQSEIAKEMNISISRVSQRIKTIRRIIFSYQFLELVILKKDVFKYAVNTIRRK